MKQTILSYPETRREDVVDIFHGVAVPDPYRWLERQESDEVRGWVEQQNELTASVLRMGSEREEIRARLTGMLHYRIRSVPVRRGERLFYQEREPTMEQPVFVVQDGLRGERRVLIDPNTLSANGSISIGDTEPSHNGRLVAYELCAGGADSVTIRAIDADTGAMLDEVLEGIRGGMIAWDGEDAGFYYSTFPEHAAGLCDEDANRFHKLFYHRLGTSRESDLLIMEDRVNPEKMFYPFSTPDRQFIVIMVCSGVENRDAIWLIDREDPSRKPYPLLPPDAENRYIGNEGDSFYFLSSFGAPRRCIIAVDRATGERRTIIAEEARVIENAEIIEGGFLLNYLDDVCSRLELFELSGAHRGTVALPALGTVGRISACHDDARFIYSFTSFSHPKIQYIHDVGTGETSVFFAPDLDIDPELYTVSQMFCRSGDGERIPLIIAHRRDLAIGAETPCYLYGYGAYGNTLQPGFSSFNVLWMDLGGITAIANVRGGGEYGEGWHEGGMLDRKQRSFDDFIAVAEHLISTGHTSSRRLAIAGGSAGGTLVGACMLQRPELFGAVVADVGFFDLLRFPQASNGTAQIPEFGDPSIEEHFHFLHAYSLLHNVRPGVCYPASLIRTGENDQRVPPPESYKFASLLQHANAGPAPILLHVEKDAGHGMGNSTSKYIRQTCDTLTFLRHTVGREG